MTNMHYTFNILNIIIYIIIKYWPLMTFGMFDIIGSFYIHDSEWERPSKATLWFHFRFKTCLTNDDGQYHQHRMLKPDSHICVWNPCKKGYHKPLESTALLAVKLHCVGICCLS